jgi:subtilisin
VALAVLALSVSAGAASAVVAGSADEMGRYIVVFEDDVEYPASFAHAQTEQVNGGLGFVYRYALNGYSASLTWQAVEALRRNPRVKYVVADGLVEAQEQTVPTGIARAFAAANKNLDIDGVDDHRIDVDVAVIDSGTSNTHPDLNVVARTDCSNGTELSAKCVDESGTDPTGHGTHVAGTIGAIDNGIGVVGVAPGARIWAVKVLETGPNWTSEIVAGMDWVTGKRKDENPANDIEVANMSLGCAVTECSATMLDEAVIRMVAAGVVAVVSAGNKNADAKGYAPANSASALTVSAIADYDGKPEGKGSIAPPCENLGLDDQRASFSNYGAGIDVAAPGVCIYSTLATGGYGYKNGTSMAAPEVAGAAAVLAAQDPPKSKADVEEIEEAIEKAGNLNWTDTSGDGTKEPLLDMSNELTFWGWTAPPTYFTSVGSVGSGSGQFNAPADVEVDPATGDLLVADQNNNRIQRLNSKGEYLSQFGTNGSGNGQFKSPRSIAVDSKGNIWVADSGNFRIQKFKSNGEFIKECGSQGTGPGQFSSKGPKAIAVGGEDSVWVTDYSNRVLKFNYNCSYVTSITGFSETAGVDVAAGKVWVTDWLANKVKAYTEAASLQLEFGTAGSGAGQINGPDGLEVDSKGNVWVLETENDRVQQFNLAGKYRSQFGAGQFTVTKSVSLTSDGKGGLWFAHNTGNRLQKWIVPEG